VADLDPEPTAELLGDDRAVAMRRLGLEPGFTLDELKRRFKALAKRHHPDLNGGDRAAEARLREIIEAYRYLLDHRLHA
jgi:DnaJ-class molecular chaperone